jgi:hypothetical protein
MDMALSQKLSDVIDMRIDVDQPTGRPVVEIEFRFVRYRLVVDDQSQAERLMKLVKLAMDETVAAASEKPKLPRFYLGKVK